MMIINQLLDKRLPCSRDGVSPFLASLTPPAGDHDSYQILCTWQRSPTRTRSPVFVPGSTAVTNLCTLLPHRPFRPLGACPGTWQSLPVS